MRISAGRFLLLLTVITKRLSTLKTASTLPGRSGSFCRKVPVEGSRICTEPGRRSSTSPVPTAI